MKYHLLVVTDHATHSASNSLYELAIAMRDDRRCKGVWVCSKGVHENEDFFSGILDAPVYAASIKDGFEYEPGGAFFQRESVKLDKNLFDAILVRMPQPLDKVFMKSLEAIIPAERIINKPTGTIETSSKEFLVHLSHLCPLPKLVRNTDEAVDLSHQYEIVLKPLYSYGGRGIVRLSKEHCWMGTEKYDVGDFHALMSEVQFPMLSMRYLPNVSFGDKRTIVVNRQILGSALRLPAANSWICNVAQGGHAIISEPDVEELKIEEELTPILFEKGIVMYGFDTLVDDDGKRVLSEINTLSIGGLGPLEELSGQPILKKISVLLWDHIEKMI